jgi:hypothetical protein
MSIDLFILKQTMMNTLFGERLATLNQQYEQLILRPNERAMPGNGIFFRYRYPALTAAHAPLFWRYDLDERSNPFLMERFGINGVFNAGAIKFNDRYIMMLRVEGWDRKSFFAIAESPNGIDRFRFWDSPVHMPGTGQPETNIYDIRLTRHEDGWIYGLFCTEKRDPEVPPADQSSAVAQCGIARTRDLVAWERLATSRPPPPNNATSSSIRSLSMANMLSIPARRTDSSMPAAAAASASVSRRRSPMPSSKRRPSSIPGYIIPSTRRRTASGPLPSDPPWLAASRSWCPQHRRRPALYPLCLHDRPERPHPSSTNPAVT